MLVVMEGHFLRVGLGLAEVAVAGVFLVVRTMGIGVPSLPDATNFEVPFPSTVSVPSPSRPDGGATAAPDPWVVADCVTPRPQRDPVDCTQPHQGVITARVTATTLCPAGTDYHRQIPSTKRIACVDEA
jgi:hypothetical protein